MAQQDQWQQDPASHDDGAILRLEAALRRIAAAAGRRQDELRVAELTARAAQHEAGLLLQARADRDQADRQREEADALRRVDEQAVQRDEEMRELASRLDGLIATVRTAIPDWTPGQALPSQALPGQASSGSPGQGSTGLGASPAGEG